MLQRSPIFDGRDAHAGLSREQQLVGTIAGADWSAGVQRVWPAEIFRDIDWAQIRHLGWQYKLRPMIAACLREAGWPEVPAAIRAAIEEAEAGSNSRTLQQLQLLRAICAAAPGLRVLAIKGVSLSLHLYNDPFIREAFDLDFLVHPDDMEAFAAVLEGLGLQRQAITPPLSAYQAGLLRRFNHEVKFRHRESGLFVEAHDVLTYNRHLMATNCDGLWARRGAVALGPQSVAILGDGDLICYVGIHAARHCWERWKWIADIAGLVRKADGEQRARWRARAARDGNEDLFDSWLLLAAAVTGVAAQQGFSRAAQRQAARAFALSRRPRQQETAQTFPYQLSLAAIRARLKPSWRHGVLEVASLFVREEDWYTLRLPDRLAWAHFLLWPVRFAWRRLRSFMPARS